MTRGPLLHRAMGERHCYRGCLHIRRLLTRGEVTICVRTPCYIHTTDQNNHRLCYQPALSASSVTVVFVQQEQPGVLVSCLPLVLLVMSPLTVMETTEAHTPDIHDTQLPARISSTTPPVRAVLTKGIAPLG